MKKVQETIDNFGNEVIYLRQELDFVLSELSEVHRAAYLRASRAEFLLQVVEEQLRLAAQALDRPPRKH